MFVSNFLEFLFLLSKWGKGNFTPTSKKVRKEDLGNWTSHRNNVPLLVEV